MPDQPPDLRARVVSVERGESTTAASDAVPAGVLVEGKPSQEPTAAGQGTEKGGKGTPGKGQRYLLRLKIAPETRLLTHRREGGTSEVSVEDLAPGQAVEVWHSPETGRSYPAQARAHTILIR